MNGGPEVNKPCRDWFFGPQGFVTTKERCNKDEPPSHPLCKQLHEELPETKEFYTHINNGTEKVNEDQSCSCMHPSLSVPCCRFSVTAPTLTGATAGAPCALTRPSGASPASVTPSWSIWTS